MLPYERSADASSLLKILQLFECKLFKSMIIYAHFATLLWISLA